MQGELVTRNDSPMSGIVGYSRRAMLRIDSQRRIVYSSFAGEVNDDHLLEQGWAIKQHPDFNPDFDEIADFTNVAEIKVTVGCINSIAKSESLFRPSARHLIVAPQELAFAISRMYQSMAARTRPNVIVVRTLAEALEFLGISDSSIFE